MSYTIDTISNSSIVVDDEYERRSLAVQAWEMTDRPVLELPIDGASGVSQTPTFEWAEYVKDIPIDNLVYKLEVVDIASSGTTPNWTNAFSIVTEATSANLREQLDDTQFYAWRVSALSRTQPETFIDTFERASLGDDYETNTIQGTGSSSIVNDELVIELDATSATARQSLRLLKNFENPNILIKGIKFSKTASNFEVILYFNEQGVIQNNQMNGYYLYFFGDDLRVGKSVNYSPSDKQSKTLSRTDSVPYNLRLRTTNGHVRITIWNPATESEPSPQLDWTDNNSPYISGGITFIPVAYGDSLVETITVDDIEVTFSEGVVTNITGVTVSGSTSDITEGETRQFSATVEGTGNVQQSVNWTATGGTINEFGLFTAATGAGACSVTATSTQDDTVSNTVNFNRVEEVVNPPLTGSRSGDEAALEAFWGSTTGWTDSTGWGSSMSLDDTIYGVTCEGTGSNRRVVEVNLVSNGINGTIAPDFFNLSSCRTINLLRNGLNGAIPDPTNLQSVEWCRLSGRDDNLDNAGYHPGKSDTSGNSFTSIANGFGSLPNLQFLQVEGAKITDSLPSDLGQSTSLVGIDFSWGQWSGVIPSDYLSIPTLKYFRCSEITEAGGVGLSGELPDVPASNNILAIRLKRNVLGTNTSNSGIPSSWSNLTSARWLVLDENDLNGIWPSYWNNGDFTQINTLRAEWNNFTGTLHGFNNLTGLRSFSLRGSDLTGGVPATINDPFRVINFTFGYGPDFSGSQLPEDFTSFYQIRQFEWRGCNLDAGPIPKFDWLSPSDFDNASDADFRGNNYTSANWSMIDDGRETEGGSIVQKTRRQWYEYFFTRSVNF